jgi:hypothetical protein
VSWDCGRGLCTPARTFFVQSFFLLVDLNPANHGGLLTVEEAREPAAALAGVATDKQLAVCKQLLRGCRPPRRHIRSGVV